jgi:hypothetical protein
MYWRYDRKMCILFVGGGLWAFMCGRSGWPLSGCLQGRQADVGIVEFNLDEGRGEKQGGVEASAGLPLKMRKADSRGRV